MLVTPIRRYSRPSLPYSAAVTAFEPASAVAALDLSGPGTAGASGAEAAAGGPTAAQQ